MRVTYDSRCNIGYIRLREKRDDVEAVRVSDGLTVDIAPDGKIYGIELPNAKEQLQLEGSRKLIAINQLTGEQSELPLPLTL